MMSRKQRTLLLLAAPPVAVAMAARHLLAASAALATLCGALAFFAICDGWYFVRLLWWTLCETVHDTIHRGEKRASIFAKSILPGRILPVDIDRNAHCNNARFLRECGFARRDLWHNNGIWRLLKLTNGNLVVGAQSVRFRRELSLWQHYKLETRLLCWDERAFYVEHRFVTTDQVSGKPFVNAIVLVKNSVIGKLSPAKLIEKLPALGENESTSPPVPDDVRKWIESNDLSSKMLRSESFS